MGRRSAQGATTAARTAGLAAMGALAVPALGFVLEVAMVAAVVYWGFRRTEPWNLVLGLGVPAVVVVLWGVFLAPRSARRLPENVVAVVALVLFLASAAALAAAGSPGLAAALAVASAVWFAATWRAAAATRRRP